MVFGAGTKVFEEALNAVKFLRWLKKIGTCKRARHLWKNKVCKILQAGNSKQLEKKDFRLYTFVNWTVDGTQIQNLKSNPELDMMETILCLRFLTSDFFEIPILQVVCTSFPNATLTCCLLFFTHFWVGANSFCNATANPPKSEWKKVDNRSELHSEKKYYLQNRDFRTKWILTWF